MQFGEAFRELGYKLGAPRQDWSAENGSGVCLSLWQKEIHPTNRGLWIDTTVHCGPLEIWRSKPGNRKRIDHIYRAVSSLDGFVDVVLVNGTPGEGYDDAHPWKPEQRKGHRWRVVHFDPQTGHFRAETVPPEKQDAQT
jgi:hypothetical protein